MYLENILVVVKCSLGEMLDKIPWTFTLTFKCKNYANLCQTQTNIHHSEKKLYFSLVERKCKKETGQHAFQLHMLPKASSVALQLHVFYY